MGFFIGAGALVLRGHIPVETGWWQRIMQAILATHESYLPSKIYSDAQFVDNARQFASVSLLVAAGTFLLLAGLLFAARSSKAAGHTA